VSPNGINGPIDVQQGTLSITNGNALGNGSAANTVTVESTSGISGTLEIDNSGGTFKAPITEQLLLNGIGSPGQGALFYSSTNTSNTATWAGSITLDSDASIGSDHQGQGSGMLIITGGISDTSTGHGITKKGPGVVAFAGPNTYRGITAIDN